MTIQDIEQNLTFFIRNKVLLNKMDDDFICYVIDDENICARRLRYQKVYPFNCTYYSRNTFYIYYLLWLNTHKNIVTPRHILYMLQYFMTDGYYGYITRTKDNDYIGLIRNAYSTKQFILFNLTDNLDDIMLVQTSRTGDSVHIIPRVEGKIKNADCKGVKIQNDFFKDVPIFQDCDYPNILKMIYLYLLYKFNYRNAALDSQNSIFNLCYAFNNCLDGCYAIPCRESPLCSHPNINYNDTENYLKEYYIKLIKLDTRM